MNPLKISQIILVFFLFIGALSAQDEQINTDRPDQSDGVYTLPKSKFQIEEGITIAKEVLENNFLLRVGLTRSTEARVSLDFGRTGELSGLMPVTFSVKQRLIKQRHIIPAITLVGYLSIGRFATPDFRQDVWPYSVKLAFENELSEHITLGYNIGTSDSFKSMDLTLNLGYSPVDQFSGFSSTILR